MPGIDYSETYSRLKNDTYRAISEISLKKLRAEQTLRDFEYQYRRNGIDGHEHINSIHYYINTYNNTIDELNKFKYGVFVTHEIPISTADKTLNNIINGASIGGRGNGI